MKFRLILAATLLLGALPLTAHAQQPWIADRRYGEGIGVRTGDLELHPGIAGEFGYDSNYFARAPSEDPLAAYRLRITPSITLSTLGPQRREGIAPVVPTLDFKAGAFLSYNELIAADSAHSKDFSKQRHVDGGGDLSLDLFPQGRFGVDTHAKFLRVVQPSNDVDTENAYDRDTIGVGGGLTWRPGGGLFEWRAGYDLLYNYFEHNSFTDLNNYQHTVGLRGRWRFLPRTALLYDGTYSWIHYANSTEQNDGSYLKSRIGMNGLVTNHLGFLGMIGWGGTFYDAKSGQPHQQFDSLLAQAELKWYLGGQQSLESVSAPVGLSWVAAGYTRDFNTSYLGNFYRRDRGYATVSYLLGGVFITELTGGIANIAFPPSYFPNTAIQRNGSFSERRIDAKFFAEYRLSDTFAINTTETYDANITDEAVLISPGGAGDKLEFARWQAFLGVRWFM